MSLKEIVYFFKILFTKVHNINEFIVLFGHCSPPLQVLIGFLFLGIFVLIYIFVVAIFVDKHI